MRLESNPRCSKRNYNDTLQQHQNYGPNPSALPHYFMIYLHASVKCSLYISKEGSDIFTSELSCTREHLKVNPQYWCTINELEHM